MSSIASDSIAAPSPLDETRQTILQAARRQFDLIPGERVVDHVRAFTTEAYFAVRAAALEALERRWRFAKRDNLRVDRRPDGGYALGSHTTSRVEPKTRPRIAHLTIMGV